MARYSALIDLHKNRGAVLAEESGWLLPRHFGDPAREHRAVRSHAGLLDLCDRAYLRLHGPDRVSYLQGMVSNDVAALAPGQGLYAAVLDVHGKILADVRVFCDQDCFYVDLWEPLKEKILTHLDHYLVADEVEILDVTEKFGTLSLQGPKAKELVGRLWPGVEIAPARYSHGSAKEDRWTAGIIRDTHTGAEGFDLVIGMEALPDVAARIEEAGKDLSLEWVGRAAQETLRIEAGIALYGADMDEGNLLLETGLKHAVSFSKGCYLGQEVVERIRSRGHVNRMLVGMVFDGKSPARPGDPVRSGDKEAGKITSATFSPVLDRAIALGYVSRDCSAPETRVSVRSGATILGAEITVLPFVPPAVRLE